MPIPTPLFPAVVIGGGISGLTCAYRLQQAGVGVCVLDAGSRPGGLIATVERDGFRLELGPQSFLLTGALRELLGELGLTEELLHPDSRAPRYILLHGKLVPAPLAPPSLLTTPLLNLRTKWRIFTEMARRAHPPTDDESIAVFVRRKFGNELLEKLLAPFVSGIYAGDPEKLSLRAAFPKLHEFESKYGSVLRGAMKSRPAKGMQKAELSSFRGGMETLPRTLRMKLGNAYRGDTSVLSLRRVVEQEAFEIVAMRDGSSETITASTVIVATPAYTAAEILRENSGQFSTVLSKITYAPVAVISAGYGREQIRHAGDGFGFLVPRSEGLRVLGTVWNSSLFPGSAPSGTCLFTSFAGGATDPEFCERSDREIGDTVCSEVEKILGITGPAILRVVQRYRRALPQYNIGHGQTIAALCSLANSIPGLFFAGNYLEGPAIGACVEQASQTATNVANRLRSPS